MAPTSSRSSRRRVAVVSVRTTAPRGTRKGKRAKRSGSGAKRLAIPEARHMWRVCVCPSPRAWGRYCSHGPWRWRNSSRASAWGSKPTTRQSPAASMALYGGSPSTALAPTSTTAVHRAGTRSSRSVIQPGRAERATFAVAPSRTISLPLSQPPGIAAASPSAAAAQRKSSGRATHPPPTGAARGHRPKGPPGRWAQERHRGRHQAGADDPGIQQDRRRHAQGHGPHQLQR
jgi:hypothetical protein